MLRDLYVLERLTLKGVAAHCGLTIDRVKRHLERFEIPLRDRKGRAKRSTTIIVTPQLLREVSMNGIPATAKRMDVQPNALRLQLRKLSPEEMRKMLESAEK